MNASCLPQADQEQLDTLPAKQEVQPHPELANALRQRTNNIVEQWRDESMLMQPRLYQKAREEFEDEIDQILTAMADALETDESNQWLDLANTAPKHGFQRFIHDFTLGDLTGEYRLLRRVIVDQVEDALGLRCARSEAFSLHASIDFMVRQGVLALAHQQKKQLMEASETKLKYASFVAHDLANYFLYFSAMLGALQHELAKHPELQHAVDSLKQAMQSLEQIKQGTRSMVEQDRLRQSGAIQKVTTVNLREAVTRITNVMRDAARSKGLDFDVTIKEQAAARTDADLVSMILQNLIGNAIKHAPPLHDRETQIIQIEAENADDGGLLRCENGEQTPGPAWTIAVRDHGLGMSKQQKQALCEMLEDGDKVATPGHGLGMSIIAQAARLLHTRISIDSEEGHGSTFRFSVPCA